MVDTQAGQARDLCTFQELINQKHCTAPENHTQFKSLDARKTEQSGETPTEQSFMYT